MNEAHPFLSQGFHTEAALAQFLPPGKNTCIAHGVSGFCYQQVSGDSGPGATRGGLVGRSAGPGPVLNLSQIFGNKKPAIQAKWLPEFDTANRCEGNRLRLTAGIAF